MTAPHAEIPADLFARIRDLRRDLHRHPELSWQEARTQRRITAELDALGIPWSPLLEHGIIAEIPGRCGRSDGQRVALRADMDALPVHEETGLPFASEVDGVMHACGHDGHASLLVGAAALLQEAPAPRPVRLIWQPAEETGEGAPACMRAGVLDDVACIFGAHVDRHYPAGIVALDAGPMNASTDMFHIDIHGQQGHGARPHEAVDTVVVGSLLVTALQTIVSREVDPADPSVISVGRFDAGTAANVIAGHARLSGTIRAHRPATQARLHAAIERIGAAIGQLHGARVEVEIQRKTPPLVNTPEMAGIARAAAVYVLGEPGVRPMHTVNMGGEDFACYLTEVPGAYVRIGGQVAGREGFPAHSSRFDFDERALAVGAAWMAAVARRAAEWCDDAARS